MNNCNLKEALKLKGDKYSDNFLKLSKKRNSISKVLLVPWDMFDGHDSKKGTLYFVCDHSDSFGLSGVGVHRVRCGYFTITCCVSFSNIHYSKIKTEDVTEWFIKNYTEKGKCMFDDNSHDWVKINSHARKCGNCGKHEQREVKTIVNRERKEIWI